MEVAPVLWCLPYDLHVTLGGCHMKGGGSRFVVLTLWPSYNPWRGHMKGGGSRFVVLTLWPSYNPWRRPHEGSWCLPYDLHVTLGGGHMKGGGSRFVVLTLWPSCNPWRRPHGERWLPFCGASFPWWICCSSICLRPPASDFLPQPVRRLRRFLQIHVDQGHYTYIMVNNMHCTGQEVLTSFWLIWLLLNVTFSYISAIQWRDNCPVSKFRPAAGHPTAWAAMGLKRAKPTSATAPGRQRAHTRWGYAGNRTRISRSTVQSATSTPPQRASNVTRQGKKLHWSPRQFSVDIKGEPSLSWS